MSRKASYKKALAFEAEIKSFRKSLVELDPEYRKAFESSCDYLELSALREREKIVSRIGRKAV